VDLEAKQREMREVGLDHEKLSVMYRDGLYRNKELKAETQELQAQLQAASRKHEVEVTELREALAAAGRRSTPASDSVTGSSTTSAGTSASPRFQVTRLASGPQRVHVASVSGSTEDLLSHGVATLATFGSISATAPGSSINSAGSMSGSMHIPSTMSAAVAAAAAAAAAAAQSIGPTHGPSSVFMATQPPSYKTVSVSPRASPPPTVRQTRDATPPRPAVVRQTSTPPRCRTPIGSYVATAPTGSYVATAPLPTARMLPLAQPVPTSAMEQSFFLTSQQPTPPQQQRALSSASFLAPARLPPAPHHVRETVPPNGCVAQKIREFEERCRSATPTLGRDRASDEMAAAFAGSVQPVMVTVRGCYSPQRSRRLPSADDGGKDFGSRQQVACLHVRGGRVVTPMSQSRMRSAPSPRTC